MANLNRLAAAAAGLVACISIGSASAQDWPQWRGPNRDGKLTGFTAPAAWPKELKQNWKVEVGLGDATPALVAGKLYAFGRKDANEVVTCIDAANGKVLWTSSYPADYVVTGAAGTIRVREARLSWPTARSARSASAGFSRASTPPRASCSGASNPKRTT